MAKNEFADIDKLFSKMSKECASSKAWDMSPKSTKKKKTTTKKTKKSGTKGKK